MTTFNVTDMTCGGCAAAITRAIQQDDPAAIVNADPATKQVDVESSLLPGQIVEAITRAGYRVAE